MEFRTLQQLASRPANERPGHSSSIPMLGKRLLGYKYDTADFAKYLATVTSYLENHSHARRALSAGGLIARIAREVLSVSAILTGPSEDALEGKQEVLFCGDEVYVDDGLSEEVKQMICGPMLKKLNMPVCPTLIPLLLRLITLFSRPNFVVFLVPSQSVWQASGFNVGHWNPECEECTIGSTHFFFYGLTMAR
jgi:hypothetical protein